VVIFSLKNKPMKMSMKKLLSFIAFGILFIGCSKDNEDANVLYTPNLVTVGLSSTGSYHFTFYDLNHADNKDKRYFRVRRSGTDNFVVSEEPKPLDSLATGWPAGVRHVNFASGEQNYNYNIDVYVRRWGNAFVQESYSALPFEPIWRYMTRNGGNSVIPHGHAMSSNEIYTFYFGPQSFYQKYPQHSGENLALRPIGDFCQACGTLYDWSTVKHVVVLGDNPMLGRFYFFDFEKWQYWYVDDAIPVEERVASLPVSLDHFVQWPQGWGKKK
jgi:hypothetical protein